MKCYREIHKKDLQGMDSLSMNASMAITLLRIDGCYKYEIARIVGAYPESIHRWEYGICTPQRRKHREALFNLAVGSLPRESVLTLVKNSIK